MPLGKNRHSSTVRGKNRQDDFVGVLTPTLFRVYERLAAANKRAIGPSLKGRNPSQDKRSGTRFRAKRRKLVYLAPDSDELNRESRVGMIPSLPSNYRLASREIRSCETYKLSVGIIEKRKIEFP